MNHTLFLASGNRYKIAELQEILSPLGYHLKSPLDIGSAEEVDEDQDSLEGNALKKARFWFQKTGLPALADDTGLEVNALGGAPGVFSARYAGDHATFQDNVNKLLKELHGITDRRARFRTVIALVTGSGEYTFEGSCDGVITSEPRGEKGFGYDPIFQPNGYTQTFAELESVEKNKISHRGKATGKFVEFLKSRK
ncbi:MAG: RdgB/HAM1 family non-canonical purine NTP pyrophosphatase [Balneolaceae bacterium]